MLNNKWYKKRDKIESQFGYFNLFGFACQEDYQSSKVSMVGVNVSIYDSKFDFDTSDKNLIKEIKSTHCMDLSYDNIVFLFDQMFEDLYSLYDGRVRFPIGAHYIIMYNKDGKRYVYNKRYLNGGIKYSPIEINKDLDKSVLLEIYNTIKYYKIHILIKRNNKEEINAKDLFHKIKNNCHFSNTIYVKLGKWDEVEFVKIAKSHGYKQGGVDRYNSLHMAIDKDGLGGRNYVRRVKESESDE